MNQAAHTPANEMLVKKSIVVSASPERAFEVFTKQMSAWWPLASHKIGKADAKEAIIEPRVGGRWFERGVDGSECNWGHVRVWDPPGRLTLTWEITADWQADSNLITEVDVRFIREGSQTRVELEHRMLDAYGARAPEMKGIFDSEGGWTGLLNAFGKHANAS